MSVGCSLTDFRRSRECQKLMLQRRPRPTSPARRRPLDADSSLIATASPYNCPVAFRFRPFYVAQAVTPNWHRPWSAPVTDELATHRRSVEYSYLLLDKALCKIRDQDRKDTDRQPLLLPITNGLQVAHLSYRIKRFSPTSYPSTYVVRLASGAGV